jgi:hypothetical protein
MSDQSGPPAAQPPSGPGRSHPSGPLGPGDSAGSSSQPMFGDSQREYPQQELLPHVMQPQRSRKGWIIGLVVLVLLVGGGIGAWLVSRGSDDSGRAEYCTALKKLVPDNDLITALTRVDPANSDQLTNQLKNLVAVAPSSVDQDWQTLEQALTSAVGPGGDNPAAFIPAFTAVQSIIRDANDNCGMSIQLPGLP